jgi:hypothetical protein
LPNSVGKSGLVGAKVGAIWGLGHGVSATFIGFCAFFLKDRIGGKFTSKLSSFTESAVGVSLLLIGLLGLKESLETSAEEKIEEASGKGMSNGAIFANGLLHGFSWDGAPSIAPAIAMTSWRSATFFLLAYSIGTIIAMSISAGTISSLSNRLGKISKAPDFPKKISIFSSCIAIAIGIYWIIQALF